MTEKRFTICIDSNDRKSIWDDERTEEEPLLWLTRFDRIGGIDNVCKLLNEQHEQIERLKRNFKALDELKCEIAEENEQLKQTIQEYKAILQDMGILMSDEDVVNIRNDIADKLLKPLFKSNGFDVDIDTTDGFTIIPKGDVE